MARTGVMDNWTILDAPTRGGTGGCAGAIGTYLCMGAVGSRICMRAVGSSGRMGAVAAGYVDIHEN